MSPGKSLPRHQGLSSRQALQREPLLRADGLLGAFVFSDGQVDLAERLAVEATLAAEAAGATVANYAEVTGLERVASARKGGAFRVTALDHTNGQACETSADLVFNAGGPWVDDVLQTTGATRPRQVGGTRGSHLVLRPSALALRQAVYAPARSDGRPFFVIPWLGMTLIGTTDIRHDGQADYPQASQAEVAYLLEEANALLSASLRPEDVLYTYCGVRPLPFEQQDREGKITRRHFLVDHQEHGLPGLYSLVGGKLTTHRSVGRKALQVARQGLGERWPYPPAQHVDADAPAQFEAVWGRRASDVFSRYKDEPAMHQPLCEHAPEPTAVLAEAAHHEHAVSLGDVFLRRTLVGWRECQGLHIAESAAALLGRELRWDHDRQKVEVERYQKELSAVHPAPGQGSSAAVAPSPV